MATVVLYPCPLIGHLISMVELGKLLLSQNSSLSISVLIPSLPFDDGSSISSYISSVSSAFPSITFHSLPAVPLSLGHPSNYPDTEQILFESIGNNNPSVQQFLHSLSQTSSVLAFILDFFCYPALEIAQSFQIPSYFFFTTGAAVLSLCLNFPVFYRNSNDFRNFSFEIPGLIAVPASEMIQSVVDRGVSCLEFVKLGASLVKSNGIIVNSFELLEPRATKALKEGTCLPETPVPPVYCIGPLFANRGKEKEGVRNECLNWLDLQPSKSVVFLCFGSMGSFPEKQLKEIAVGLERSGMRFLWVVRAPPSEDKAKQPEGPPEPDLEALLPVGFLDRTKDRGLVVKSWAPQVAVLAHEAVGGFVSHCGWNSTLEAVCAGVPMIAWPLYAEQRINRIVLVEEIKIALPMNESEDRFVTSDEIEKRVKQIINSDEGDAIRERVVKLSHEAKAALSEGGSSTVALAKFVESWKQA